MRIVIIGDGKVGHKIATELSEEDYDVVVIDQNENQLSGTSNTLDVLCIPGDGADADVQKSAGVSGADLVIACTSLDEINMLSCLVARRVGARHTIARVRNPIYYNQMNFLKEDLRLSMAVNPEMEAADEISRVLLFPEASKVESFVKGKIEMVEFPIPENCPLEGVVLKNLTRTFNVRVLVGVVQRGKEVFIPDGECVLKKGDKIHIIASHQELEQFFRKIGHTSHKIRKVMMIGGGRLGFYLAKQLIDLKMQVKIIERNYDKCMELAEQLPEATVIFGDTKDHALLEEEGLRDADAFVSFTGVDEENMLAAFYAKTQGVKKIVAKVEEESLSVMTEAMGIDSVVSPKALTADLILGYVRARHSSMKSANIESIYQLVNGQIETMEFVIGDTAKYINIPLKDLPIKANNLIAAIARGSEVIVPGGMDVILPGDSVIIVTMNKKVQNFDDILK